MKLVGEDDSAPVFASVFVIVWCGAAVVTLNAVLLGGTVFLLGLGALECANEAGRGMVTQGAWGHRERRGGSDLHGFAHPCKARA